VASCRVVSRAAPGDLCAAPHAAPGDLCAASDAASSRPSGPQLLLTSLARQLALPNPRPLLLQGRRLLPPLLLGGKSPFDAKALPIRFLHSCLTPGFRGRTLNTVHDWPLNARVQRRSKTSARPSKSARVTEPAISYVVRPLIEPPALVVLSGRHLRCLLRARRERPRRCAAEKRDELAPFHRQFLPCFEDEDSTAGDLPHCGISHERLSALGQQRTKRSKPHQGVCPL